MKPRHWIATKRLVLESNTEPGLEDLSRMVRWLNDPEVVRYSEQRHKTHTLQTQYPYVHSFVWPSQFRLILRNNELIGTITAHVDIHNSVADMGIMIGDTQAWGEDLGTEAWIGLMDHLFGIGIRKIEAGCMDLNRAMIGIFKKSGMTREGHRPLHFISSNHEGGHSMCGLEQWGKFKDG